MGKGVGDVIASIECILDMDDADQQNHTYQV